MFTNSYHLKDLVQNVDVASDDDNEMGGSMPMRSSGRGSARADVSGNGCHHGCSGDHGLCKF